MEYAIDIAPLGELSDATAIVRLARTAEEAGWDGLSIWDSTGVSMGTSSADPFVSLAGVAAATERLRLILSVVALPRRRPQLVVQAAATLDRLSGGRLVIGCGAGGDPGDFAAFGEPADAASRMPRFDEAIDLVDALLRGETVGHDGPGFVVRDVAVGPRPVQQPRPPIWLGGMRPGALRRAARWDGWIAIAVADDGSGISLSPEAFGEKVERVRAERAALGRDAEPFDVAVFAFSDPYGPELAQTYAAAGATWWLESLSPMRGSLDDLLRIVAAGPPRP
ncbi:MAG TPA: LLM class flavin-dependent oxidoreductase [Candidatus Limnocylindrales bacterium]|nr:LLM class flavin-dependent oxidoreductase [Candidatus Limnocylindrales bacterium]